MQMKPLVLAFVGDCVYELYIRNYLISEKYRDVNELHRKSVFFVKAKAQAYICLLYTSTTALYTFVESTADTRLTVTVAEEETGNPAKHIIDGDPGTRWSGSTGCPTEIVIDLGEPAHLSEISIKWFEARAYRYTIQVSREGSVYRTVANRSENTQRGTLTDSFDAQYVRYIKIRVTGTSDDSDWVSIYEVTTNAWWFHTAYDVNEEARTITVP